MPKTSLEGSIFPGLEQEQRSAPHPAPKRTRQSGAVGTSKSGENSQKTENAEASTS